MPKTTPQLPRWATAREHEGARHYIDVDAHVAYEDLLDEYRELYADGHPALTGKDWEAALADLRSEEPSAYWLEVCYQSVKLDLQIACRSFALNISIHDRGKKYRQSRRKDGRNVKLAAGGAKGGREAREHYKRLRGFLPA